MRMKIFDDYRHGCLSYMIGDEVTGKSVLIDPLEEIGADCYILDIQDMGMNISWIIETHLHADHISCAHDLSVKTGAEIIMGRNSPAKFKFLPAGEVNPLSLGQISLEFIDTPGHTEESVSIIAYDLARGRVPFAVFTGDLLFAGDVGRSDLNMDFEEEREMSLKAFNSLQRILELPDSTMVMPAHFGSSKCGGIFMSGSMFSTVGYERVNNRFLAFKEGGEFWKYQNRFKKAEPEGARVIRERNISGLLK